MTVYINVDFLHMLTCHMYLLPLIHIMVSTKVALQLLTLEKMLTLKEISILWCMGVIEPKFFKLFI